jgi:hypothetical protein
MTTRNTRELLAAVAEWLGDQHEDLSFGLKSAFDGLRLYEFWTSRADLPEYCAEATDDDGRDLAALRIEALGYDPVALGSRPETFTEDAAIGVKPVLAALVASETILDPVAHVSVPGDTDEPLRQIRAILSGEPLVQAQSV